MYSKDYNEMRRLFEHESRGENRKRIALLLKRVIRSGENVPDKEDVAIWLKRGDMGFGRNSGNGKNL